MKTVYVVTTSAALKEAALICEDRGDALVLAEQINYLGEEQSPEDFVYEVPLIGAQS